MSPESQPNREEKRNPFELHDNGALLTEAEHTNSVETITQIYDVIDKRHQDDPSDSNQIALFTIKERLEEAMLFQYFENQFR